MASDQHAVSAASTTGGGENPEFPSPKTRMLVTKNSMAGISGVSGADTSLKFSRSRCFRRDTGRSPWSSLVKFGQVCKNPTVVTRVGPNFRLIMSAPKMSTVINKNTAKGFHDERLALNLYLDLTSE
jgi:hypothetical protein